MDRLLEAGKCDLAAVLRERGFVEMPEVWAKERRKDG
jgi:hypothetical protein